MMCPFFFFQDIDGKPNWSGLCGACSMEYFDHCNFLEWDDGVGGKNRVGLKKMGVNFAWFVIFLEMLEVALSSSSMPLNKAGKKACANGLFILRTRACKSWKLLPGANGSLPVLCPAEVWGQLLASARGLECCRELQVLKPRSGAVVLIHKSAWKFLCSVSDL